MTVEIKEVHDLETEIYERVSNEYRKALDDLKSEQERIRIVAGTDQEIRKMYLETKEELLKIKQGNDHWYEFNKTMNNHPLLQNEWKKFMTLLKLLKE